MRGIKSHISVWIVSNIGNENPIWGYLKSHLWIFEIPHFITLHYITLFHMIFVISYGNIVGFFNFLWELCGIVKFGKYMGFVRGGDG